MVFEKNKIPQNKFDNKYVGKATWFLYYFFNFKIK